MPRILLIQGANMAYLGKRQPELYGTTTGAELDKLLLARAKARKCRLDIFYSHAEGEAIQRIYQANEDSVDGLLMNPAGLMYAGHALRDCLLAVRLPYVEVHMTNLEKRGKKSVLADVADGVIHGLGIQSYLLGLDALLGVIERRKAS